MCFTLLQFVNSVGIAFFVLDFMVWIAAGFCGLGLLVEGFDGCCDCWGCVCCFGFIDFRVAVLNGFFVCVADLACGVT